MIFSPRLRRIVVGPIGRLVALGVGGGCLSLLVIASHLTPAADGMGTHTQLGLEPCQFARATGLPCPTCGMTTSFSWLTRGNFLAAFWVQPMGALVGLTAMLTFWAAIYVAVTGRPVYRLLLLGPTRYYVPVIVSLAIAAWAWKIFIHLHGIDGWHG
jgi:uncharacterized protein DUF2752